MPAPTEHRMAHLRSQRQGEREDDITPRQQRPAGPLSAVGSGNVELPPGLMKEGGSRGPRSAAHFATPMSRFGGRAGGDAA